MNTNKIIIDKKTGEVKISFDVTVYKASSILKALDDFSDSCWVNADGDPLKKIDIVLKPKSTNISLETLGYEFYNYVLAMMKQANAFKV